ncbi:MAG: hypothetical protein K0Q50_920 [Vampirovibrio sp.]|nr:hypothetical protein [Vampirovibrio sp.]
MAASPPTEQGLSAMADRRRFLWLAGLGVFTFALLWLFYANPALSAPRLNRELLLWPVTFGLLWLYWAGYRLVARESVPLRWLVISGLLVGLLACMVPPFHSTDVFGYINRGWQQAHYGMNPYVYTVDHIPGWEHDPMITDHWVNNPSPYGFLYLLIAKGLCLLGGGDKENTLLVFKLGNLVVHGVTAFLVWLGATRVNSNASTEPGRQNRPVLALYLYLWNPLVLVHGLANGHNDMMMGLFVTLSAYFALIGSWVWILPALMAATLIKYGAVVILPFALLFLLKQRAWRAMGLGGLLAAGVFLLTGLPYLPDWSQFHLKEISRNAFVSHGSLHSLIYSVFKTVAKELVPAWNPLRELVRDVMKNVLLMLYTLFYGGLAVKRFRQSRYPVSEWIWDALLVMAVLVCLVSLKFYPWYLAMFFPLALFLPEQSWLRRFMLVLSGAQLFSITFIGQAHLLNFLIMTGLPIAWVWRRIKKSHGKAAMVPVESQSERSV